MNLTELEADLRAKADTLHAIGDDIIGRHAAVVHDAADALTRLTSSRIVTEVMQYGEDLLPSPTVDAIVNLIRGAGDAAARIAQLTTPPVAPPAEPAPAEPVQ